MFKNIIPLLLLTGAGVGAWFYYKRMTSTSSGSNTPANNTGVSGVTGGVRSGDSLISGVPADTSADYQIPSASQPSAGTALYSPLGQPLQGASTVTSQSSTTNSEIKSVLDPGNLLPALF